MCISFSLMHLHRINICCPTHCCPDSRDKKKNAVAMPCRNRLKAVKIVKGLLCRFKSERYSAQSEQSKKTLAKPPCELLLWFARVTTPVSIPFFSEPTHRRYARLKLVLIVPFDEGQRRKNIQHPIMSIESCSSMKGEKEKGNVGGIFAFFDNFCRPNMFDGDAGSSSTEGSTTTTE